MKLLLAAGPFWMGKTTTIKRIIENLSLGK
jgi:hypothetical protein